MFDVKLPYGITFNILEVAQPLGRYRSWWAAFVYLSLIMGLVDVGYRAFNIARSESAKGEAAENDKQEAMGKGNVF